MLLAETRPASLGSVTKPLLDLLPRDRFGLPTVELIKTAIKFLSLRLSQREGLRVPAEAFPQLSISCRRSSGDNFSISIAGLLMRPSYPSSGSLDKLLLLMANTLAFTCGARSALSGATPR
jgi:hypothetical protein